MGRFSLEQVAERAGVPVAFVDRLVELQVVAPDEADSLLSPGDVRRTRFVHGLEQGGVPLDAIASAIRSGRGDVGDPWSASPAQLPPTRRPPGEMARRRGDGLLQAARGCRALRVGHEERLPAEGLPQPSIGIEAGPLILQDGDYFGRTVNMAARIAAHARAGQVLVGDTVQRETTSASVEFLDIGSVELKGVSKPVRLHEARRLG